MSAVTQAQVRNPLAALHDLGKAARRAEHVSELEFMAVNDSRALVPYRQAALWQGRSGVRALSGVVKLEAHVPYVQWLNRVLVLAAARSPHEPWRLTASDLPADLAAEWAQWLPAHALWLPLPPLKPLQAAALGSKQQQQPDLTAGDAAGNGLEGWLLVRDLPWTDAQQALLGEWVDMWHHARHGLQASRPRWQLWSPFDSARGGNADAVPRPWWRRRATHWMLAVLMVACLPVRLSVLVPGELVPAKPAVLRSPMDGVIDVFYVQPNQVVKKDQPVFGFDELLIQSKREVTRQALGTAEAEYRQTAQQALTDPKSKAQLAMLIGRIEEKRTELDYVNDQLKRAQVLAPQDGIALFDDPSEWIGRPVTVGDRILRLAALDDVEVEAWVPLADAIALDDDARVSLYLSASPLAPVDASLRYLAHEAVERPDLSYAYRLRARLSEPTEHRIGQKGTAKLYGRWVPLVYWVLRRPLASLRAYVGW